MPVLDLPRARTAMEGALALKPDCDAVRFNLACVHARLGNEPAFTSFLSSVGLTYRL